MIPLAAFEEIIDASGTAARIEAMLPIGVRARQLHARTLLLGCCSCPPITARPTSPACTRRSPRSARTASGGWA